MTVNYFQSTDPGAPALSGQAGKLIELLDACLINGYGSVTLSTLTSDGAGLATATVDAGHGLSDQCTVEIAGANQAAYNGQHRITRLGATQFTFAVSGTPTTPATGIITAKRAALGWIKPFSGINKAVYQSADVQGAQLPVRVDDTLAQYALLRGYESMSDVDTGANPFPTVAQSTNGNRWRKSSTSDATARVWTLVGDGRGFCLAVAWHASYAGLHGLHHYGDIDSWLTGDAYGVLLGGYNSDSPSAPDSDNGLTRADGTVTNGLWLARDYIGTAPVAAGNIAGPGAGAGMGTSGWSYPNRVIGGLLTAPVLLTEGGAGTGFPVRGRHRLIRVPLHTGLAEGLTPVDDAIFVSVTVRAAGATGAALLELLG